MRGPFAPSEGALRGRDGGRIARALLVLVTLLPACGAGDASNPSNPQQDMASGCDSDARADYAAGETHQGEQGHFAIQLLRADPAPPAKGDNEWDVRLLDATGAPVDGADIEVTPFMPDHGHGTSLDAQVTPAPSGGEGEYRISPINLWMPGLWQVTLSVEADGASDEIVTGVCITG